MKKALLIATAYSSFFYACNQPGKTTPVEKPITPSHSLPQPLGWETETFSIPISFAPQIKYNGTEEVRFAPGWAKPASNDYWTYCFLWSLKNNPNITATILADNLKVYYTGLIASNIEKRKIPATAIFETTVITETITTQPGDIATFSGSIHMLDYMRQEPITLNCLVHLKKCEGKEETYLFHEISPKPFTDSIWNGMHQIWSGFACNDANPK